MVIDPQVQGGRSAVDLYFLEEDGSTFKATILFEPYFYVLCKVSNFGFSLKIVFL